MAQNVTVNLTSAATGERLSNATVFLSDTWQNYTLDFSAATATSTTQIDLTFSGPAGNLWLDNVALTGPVP